MLVSFDIRFIRQDRKKKSVGMARLSEPVRRGLVESDMLDIERY